MSEQEGRRVGRALISVTDKTGVVEFAQGLVELGAEIVSTGGTARIIAEAGIPVTLVSDVTGFPEILGGRVKTLHPMIHGGVLARGDVQEDRQALENHQITPFDVVAVNLYAFEKAASESGKSIADLIEEIDIGGPTLLRAAAKNHAFVLPVVDPADYPGVLNALSEGSAAPVFRRALATKVFARTAAYDRAIAAAFGAEESALSLSNGQALRYGENPHQAATFFPDADADAGSLAAAEQLNGKALSYNNLLDADAALGVARDLGEDAVVYVKHNNPCGAARGADLAETIRIARACDSTSAFGAVVAMGRQIDLAAAEVLAETFLEVIIAPGFTPDALERLRKKKNLRLMALGGFGPLAADDELRRINGGWLKQDKDARTDPATELREAKVATARAPTESELRALGFTWAVAKHVRSNAIVFGQHDRVTAVGAGQMSRVDSVRLCGLKAGDSLQGTVVASDAFFPFRDGVDILAEAGATAIVQPGGSVRDDEVIAAANEHGLAMLLTGIRHFRH